MNTFSLKSIALISVVISTFTFTACSPAPQEQQADQETNIKKNTIIEPSHDLGHMTEDKRLTQGNLFNIARDIAKLQIETDDYIALLQQSQHKLENALQGKNIQQLQKVTGDLTQELHSLHDTLFALDLKSKEVDQIRQNLLATNQQLLTLPLLHGQFDISQVDFDQIEKQLNSIQVDAIKLATLVLGGTSTT